MTLPEYELAVSKLERGEYPDYFVDEPSALLFAALFLTREISDCVWSASFQPWADDLTERCRLIAARGAARRELEETNQ